MDTMNKFKVGDKVRVRDWIEDWLKPAAAELETIVIYRNGKTTVALDKRTGERAEAKCSKEDTYDFYTGAKIAFERLIGEEKPKEERKLYNGKVVCLTSIGTLLTKGKIYEFKDGYSQYDDGDRIPVCYGAIESFEDLEKKYPDRKFVELIEDTAEEEPKPKLYNGKVVCITSKYYKELTKGKIYEFKDGYSKYDNGNSMPSFFGAVDSFEDIEKIWGGTFVELIEDTAEKEPKLYNGKVVCVIPTLDILTKGKIYEFKDGYSRYDNGDRMPTMHDAVTSFEDLEEKMCSEFVELVED